MYELYFEQQYFVFMILLYLLSAVCIRNRGVLGLSYLVIRVVSYHIPRRSLLPNFHYEYLLLKYVFVPADFP